MPTLRTGLALLSLTAVCSCQSSHALSVDLRTDLAHAAEFFSVRLTLEDAAGERHERSLPVASDAPTAVGVRLADFPGLPSGEQRVSVALMGPSDEIVAERRMVVGLADDFVLTVLMTRSCAGVLCEPGQSCFGGVCGAEPECVADTDCDAPAECAAAQCVEGACLQLAIPDFCPQAQYCEPSSGCTSRTVPLPTCGDEPDEWTLALFSFDEPALEDATDVHRLAPEPADAPLNITTGPTSCGSAWQLGGDAHATIDDHVSFHSLDIGSLDFWLRLDAPATGSLRGIISRDAVGEELPGHLNVAVDSAGRLQVRLQTGSEAEDDLLRCSDEIVPVGRWLHVLVNFGPPDLELYVQGSLQTYAGPTDILGEPMTCGIGGSTGIDGNFNPWALGISSAWTAEGTTDVLRFPLGEAALDEVRVSRVRRLPRVPP